MYILRKRAQRLKNITFLHFAGPVNNCALTRVFEFILETRNVNNVCEYVWLHKVTIWIFKN